jgi:hypothetical protein
MAVSNAKITMTRISGEHSPNILSFSVGNKHLSLALPGDGLLIFMTGLMTGKLHS